MGSAVLLQRNGFRITKVMIALMVEIDSDWRFEMWSVW